MNARVIGAGAAAAAVAYVGLNYMGEIKTPGMKNIENRHAAAGGGHTHTPATASPMGQQDTVMGTHAKDKGVGSAHFQEKHGDHIKPADNKLAAAFNKGQYGTEQGKQN